MGWTTLPCSSGDVIQEAWFDEIKAALDERIDVVGGTKHADVAADDVVKWSATWDSILGYRGRIAETIPKFQNKTGVGENTTFPNWSLATIMTACFGGGVVDWPNKNEKLLLASAFNDMRTVINKLEWTDANTATDSCTADLTEIPDFADGDADWPTAKNNGWTDLAGEASAPAAGSNIKGGHWGKGFNSGGIMGPNSYVILELRYYENGYCSLDTSDFNGVTLTDGYIYTDYELADGDGDPTILEACSCNLVYNTEIIKNALSITSTALTYKAFQISDPDNETNKAGNTKLYMTLNDPGDDLADQDTNWTAPGVNAVNWYSRLGIIGFALNHPVAVLKCQFDYRA